MEEVVVPVNTVGNYNKGNNQVKSYERSRKIWDAYAF